MGQIIDFGRRFAQLNTSLAHKVEPLYHIKVEHHKRVEKCVKLKLQDYAIQPNKEFLIVQ